MHFENLQLSSPIIVELYKQSLVTLEDVYPNPQKGLGNMVTATPLPIHNTPSTVSNVTPTAPTSPINTSEKSAPLAFKYLGGYQKQIAIVVSEHFNPHISEEDLEFLSKMLGACKLSVQDVAIINTVANPQHAFIWDTMKPKTMLLFDVDPGLVGLAFRRPHFEIQEWAGSTFLTAPELSAFRIGNEQDIKTLKTKLWAALQKIFLGK